MSNAKPMHKIRTGSHVRVRIGATAYDGKEVHSCVYGKEYHVVRVEGDCIFVDKPGLAFNAKDLVSY